MPTTRKYRKWVCKHCGFFGVEGDFAFYGGKGTGRRRVCKPCRLTYQREQTRKRRHACLVHYSHPIPACACCGEKETRFLTLDHVNGNGANHRRVIGRQPLERWLKSNGYPSGYQVLCWNCNVAKGQGETCPHQFASVGKSSGRG